MKTSLTSATMTASLSRLAEANTAFERTYPGDPTSRRPVQTVYGGAHLFKHDAARKLGDIALATLREYAPDFAALARIVQLKGYQTLPTTKPDIAALQATFDKDADRPETRAANPAAWLAHAVHTRVLNKLQREPVEDFRIDFEDGYGVRSDAEEDACAAQAAEETAVGMDKGTLPPFIGIRVKTFSRELHARGIRTIDIYLSTLAARTGGRLPANFVVTLPKVVCPEQVSALADVFDLIEASTPIPKGSLKMDIMIETTQAIFAPDGRLMLPQVIAAARGRCTGAHFGVYDYTASCNITADHQHIVHPACDFARHMMQVALTGTGVSLSDGATNIMPIAPNRAAPGQTLTPKQLEDNRASIHRAWALHFSHIRHSLEHAYYQGWDLHPAQLPSRYAAVYSFWLESLPGACDRLRNFVEKAARATLAGDVFDDAATAQGMLNFFLEGLNRRVISEAEALRSGLTIDEMRSRNFTAILDRRARQPA